MFMKKAAGRKSKLEFVTGRAGSMKRELPSPLRRDSPQEGRLVVKHDVEGNEIIVDGRVFGFSLTHTPFQIVTYRFNRARTSILTLLISLTR